ncbi:unnamed protein product [Urochloa decumbens]|uniref:F-box domain-containing protein n=1 Tax=Urochloa decumbens TaxID=240449 RepID=A0ABC9DVI3_9POAL
MKNKEARRSSSWADLPPELLGLVLLRLLSLLDRVRLRAVCRAWRSNARLQALPSPLPWLALLDGTFLSIPDGKIIRMPAVPGDAFCCGSTDSWLFFVRSDGGCSMVNPFSKATLDLPKLSIKWFDAASPGFGSKFRKLVVPSPLESSPGSLVVAVSLDNYGTSIGMCRPSIATDFSVRKLVRVNNLLSDIAFFNGKLYGIGHDPLSKLSTFEIGLDNKPKISVVNRITETPRLRLSFPHDIMSKSNVTGYVVKEYLVECSGRLLKVKRKVESHDDNDAEGIRTWAFEVFEADLSTKPGQWRCVSDLGGQALFVGKHCSKSVPAGECTGIQEDSIYFMCDYHRGAVDPLHDSGVYNMRTGVITPLLSDTAAVPQHRGGQWRPTWIFPADDALQSTQLSC